MAHLQQAKHSALVQSPIEQMLPLFASLAPNSFKNMSATVPVYMVLELFEMARSKKACIIFDEIDAIDGALFDDGARGDNEVQRTMSNDVSESALMIPQLNSPTLRRRINTLLRLQYPRPHHLPLAQTE
jgi:hypothetical protein